MNTDLDLRESKKFWEREESKFLSKISYIFSNFMDRKRNKTTENMREGEINAPIWKYKEIDYGFPGTKRVVKLIKISKEL